MMSKMIRSVSNWYSALLVFLGLRREAIAWVKGIYPVLILQKNWQFFRELITLVVDYRLDLPAVGPEGIRLYSEAGTLIEPALIYDATSSRAGYVTSWSDVLGLFLKHDESMTPRFLVSEARRIKRKTGRCTFWDVGAYVGGYELVLGPICDRIVAFEPEEKNFELLSKNVRFNRLDNISALRYAVDSHLGTAMFHLSDVGPMMHSLLGGWSQSSGSVLVEVITLDQAAAETGINEIDLLKVDAEGAEIGVLLGGQEVLNRTSVVVVEIHRGVFARVCDILSDHGLELVGRLDAENFVYKRPEPGLPADGRIMNADSVANKLRPGEIAV